MWELESIINENSNTMDFWEQFKNHYDKNQIVQGNESTKYKLKECHVEIENLAESIKSMKIKNKCKRTIQWKLKRWSMDKCKIKHQVSVIKRNPNYIVQNELKLKETKKASIQETKLDGKICVICQNQHNLEICPVLLNKTAKKRTLLIKKLKRCFKCFQSHLWNSCIEQNCKICGKPHHFLLCYTLENNQKQTSINIEQKLGTKWLS